jgi:hypothetical protein
LEIIAARKGPRKGEMTKDHAQIPILRACSWKKNLLSDCYDEMYMSWMRLRPMHCGAVVKKPWRQRATMNVLLFGASVANIVMKRDMNIDHQRTGMRPKRCAKGTAITPPTPNIYIRKLKRWHTKTFPDKERPTSSVVAGQY